MKLVYTAGAYRAGTPLRVRDNIVQAEAAAGEIARRGAMPVCPHAMTQHIGHLASDELWLLGTLELMRRCDAVYVYDVNHLESSAGTRNEVADAHRLGIPVFIDLHALQIWLMFGLVEPRGTIAQVQP